MPNSYNIAGLIVESEINLPGLIAAKSEAVFPDVTVRLGPVPEALEGESASGPTWQMTGSQFLLRIPNVARFLLENGQSICVEREYGEEDDVAIFLIGTVFGILLHQRGQIVLHASAVNVGGKAVLFCGPSGAGKSTLAAALGKRGYSLVTDDVCAVNFRDGELPMVQPDGRQLKLWAQAIEKLDLTGERRQPVRNQLQKYYVEQAQTAPAPLPLGAVYVLREARPPYKTGIERPNVVDSARLLHRNAYRPLLVSRMNQKTNYFRAAAAMANTAGIFHLTRALDFATMPQVIDGLEQHWEESGLCEKVSA